MKSSIANMLEEHPEAKIKLNRKILGENASVPTQSHHQGVCIKIETSTVATLTKISEGAASFLSLQSVCVCV